MNYLANELKISGKDLVKFICDQANEKDHPFIYTNLIFRTNNCVDLISSANYNNTKINEKSKSQSSKLKRPACPGSR